MRVTERTLDKLGQGPLAPEVEIEGWWTSLDLREEAVIPGVASQVSAVLLQVLPHFWVRVIVGRLGKSVIN